MIVHLVAQFLATAMRFSEQGTLTVEEITQVFAWFSIQLAAEQSIREGDMIKFRRYLVKPGDPASLLFYSDQG